MLNYTACPISLILLYLVSWGIAKWQDNLNERPDHTANIIEHPIQRGGQCKPAIDIYRYVHEQFIFYL